MASNCACCMSTPDSDDHGQTAAAATTTIMMMLMKINASRGGNKQLSATSSCSQVAGLDCRDAHMAESWPQLSLEQRCARVLLERARGRSVRSSIIASGDTGTS